VVKALSKVQSEVNGETKAKTDDRRQMTAKQKSISRRGAENAERKKHFCCKIKEALFSLFMFLCVFAGSA
jgi:hypothetical protein